MSKEQCTVCGKKEAGIHDLNDYGNIRPVHYCLDCFEVHFHTKEKCTCPRCKIPKSDAILKVILKLADPERIQRAREEFEKMDRKVTTPKKIK